VSTHVVVVPLDNVHVGCDGSEVFVRLLVTDVAGAKYLLDFPWYEQFLELGRQIVSAVGYVEVADDKNEDHPWKR
jgi:hypothetical protein